MATTRRVSKAASAPARRGRPPGSTNRTKATAATRTAAKAAPAKKGADVTVYAEKEPTDYHKAFAKWIVTEVGYEPNEATSKRAAFLAGVSIATASRPAFMESDYLEEWREKIGIAKRGPKGNAAPAKAAPAKRTRKAEPEPEVEDDDDFDEEDDEIEDDEFDEEDDEFDSEDDDEEEEDDEEDEEEEEIPAPPARRGRPAKKTAPAKAAPAKRATRSAKAATTDDDDFIF